MYVLSRFGRGDTRIRGSFTVSITDTYDKIAKFISTRNAICGMFKSVSIKCRLQTADCRLQIGYKIA